MFMPSFDTKRANFFSCLAGGAMTVMCLPYYKGNFENGEYIYIMVIGMSFVGRAIGGGLHYRFKLPTKYKYPSSSIYPKSPV